MLAAGLLGVGSAQLLGAPPASAEAVPPAPAPTHNQIVSAVPQAGTPNVVDGSVRALAQVGNTVIAGGDFTSVQSWNGATTHPLRYAVAMDATTGAVVPGFAPQLDGAVLAVEPGPTPGTVFLGGQFNNVAGVRAKGVALFDVATGARLTSFRSIPMNGFVETLKIAGNRLFLGGTFTTLNAIAHGGIGTVNATTGVVDPFLSSSVTEHHNFGVRPGSANGAVDVQQLDISADGRYLIAIGNFRFVDGLPRDQVVMFDLSGAAAVVRADWATHRYEPACFNWAYDSYVRGVAFSPDGSFFAIVATGGGNTTLCDTVARFETAASTTDAQPTWVNYTGGDTLWSVAITQAAVYVGGHQRWMNNNSASDRAGSGSVPRPGIAAVDVRTGMTLEWNPGRNPRGAAAYDLLPTATGLWVGSDTDWIGDFDYKRGKVAFFPLAGGRPQASDATRALPGAVYFGNTLGGLTRRLFDGTTAGASAAATSPLNWSTVTAAAWVGGTLFYGKTDGLLYKATFDGDTFGAEALVDPYLDPTWATVDTGSGQTYRGARPTMYGSELQNATSLFYDSGRLYYTLSGQSGLYYRSFSTDSGIMAGTRSQVPGVSLTNVRGAFVTGGSLYYVGSLTGNLNRIGFTNGQLVGSATVVSGPLSGGIDWRAKSLFLGPPPRVNQPPTATIATSCSVLTCNVDSAGSVDPDGSITAYAWNFGDGATATTPTATHTYAEPGTYTVTLTVTDNDGVTGTATASVTAQAPPASTVAFRAAAGANVTFNTVTVNVPAATQPGDAMLLAVSTGQTLTPTVPAGWSQVTTVAAKELTTTVYQRVAVAGDAGSAVRVTIPASTKLSAQVLVYSGTRATSPVTAATTAADIVATTSHTAPAVPVADNGSWVVRLWVDKSSATTAWTLPAGLVARDTQQGTGTGYLVSVAADGNGSVTAGTAPAVTATTNDAPVKTTMVSLVLAQ